MGLALLPAISRALPQVTPETPQLSRPLAREILRVARSTHLAWPLVLGIAQAGSTRTYRAMSPAASRTLASRVSRSELGAGQWATAATLLGDSGAADRAIAYAHFDRAVGLEALAEGLDLFKQQLVHRVLDDPRIAIYPGGRDDLAAGRVDVRVVAVIAYLADTFGSVEVSSLVTGHREYSRPGVVSAHVYGRAVDIAALGGVPILGHQQAGDVTEKAVRALMWLPGSLEPVQIISLLTLGGPSFALPDHYDHIHVGY